MANVKVLGTGLKRLGLLLFLFIICPIMLTLGFKARKLYEDSDEIWISYVLIGLSGILIVFTIFFAFQTFRTLMDAFFKDS